MIAAVNMLSKCKLLFQLFQVWNFMAVSANGLHLHSVGMTAKICRSNHEIYSSILLCIYMLVFLFYNGSLVFLWTKSSMLTPLDYLINEDLKYLSGIFLHAAYRFHIRIEMKLNLKSLSCMIQHWDYIVGCTC